MPVHEWIRVDAGLFHAFHQHWISALCDAFNTGVLPRDYFGLPEQSIGGPVPDGRHEAEVYARKADRITVRHRHGRVVAVVEIASPGKKASRSALRAFVEKAADLVRQDIHLLIIDLFPPGPRDPQGIHRAFTMLAASYAQGVTPGHPRPSN